MVSSRWGIINFMEKTLNQFDASFYEVSQSFSFQHVVLQQCQVNQLMYYLVAGSIFVDDVSLLLLLLVEFLFYIVEFILFCSRNFFIFLPS